jgi:hypothetical protein
VRLRQLVSRILGLLQKALVPAARLVLRMVLRMVLL